MATAEEQQYLLEETKFNLQNLSTLVAESETEVGNYDMARPKNKHRVEDDTIKSPQVKTVLFGNSKQEKRVEIHSALLRDEFFYTFPVTVNV